MSTTASTPYWVKPTPQQLHCQTRAVSSGSSTTSSALVSLNQSIFHQSLMFQVTVQHSGVPSVDSRIHFGAAGNTVDSVAHLKILTQPLPHPQRIQGIDRQPIRGGTISICTRPLVFQVSAFQQEQISFLVTVKKPSISSSWLSSHTDQAIVTITASSRGRYAWSSPSWKVQRIMYPLKFTSRTRISRGSSAKPKPVAYLLTFPMTV